MENLLQGSVNTDIVSHNGQTNDDSNSKQMATKPSESVRFAPESDAEDKPVGWKHDIYLSIIFTSNFH